MGINFAEWCKVPPRDDYLEWDYWPDGTHKTRFTMRVGESYSIDKIAEINNDVDIVMKYLRYWGRVDDIGWACHKEAYQETMAAFERIRAQLAEDRTKICDLLTFLGELADDNTEVIA